MSDTYIVGFDGTEQSSRAIDLAAGRARSSGAQLHLVHVLEWSPYNFHTPEELAERHERREKELERADTTVQPVVDRLNKDGVTATREVRHGHAGDIICKIAEEKQAAQVFVGRIDDSALAQRLFGGLALTLLQIAPVPVTVVP